MRKKKTKKIERKRVHFMTGMLSLLFAGKVGRKFRRKSIPAPAHTVARAHNEFGERGDA